MAKSTWITDPSITGSMFLGSNAGDWHLPHGSQSSRCVRQGRQDNIALPGLCYPSALAAIVLPLDCQGFEVTLGCINYWQGCPPGCINSGVYKLSDRAAHLVTLGLILQHDQAYQFSLLPSPLPSYLKIIILCFFSFFFFVPPDNLSNSPTLLRPPTVMLTWRASRIFWAIKFFSNTIT